MILSFTLLLDDDKWVELVAGGVDTDDTLSNVVIVSTESLIVRYFEGDPNKQK